MQELYNSLKKKYKRKVHELHHYDAFEPFYSKFCIANGDVAMFIAQYDGKQNFEIWIQNDEKDEGATVAKNATREQTEQFIDLVMRLK